MLQEVHFHEVRFHTRLIWNILSLSTMHLLTGGPCCCVTLVNLNFWLFVCFIYFKEFEIMWNLCCSFCHDGVFMTQNWGCSSNPEDWLEVVKQCLKKSFGTPMWQRTPRLAQSCLVCLSGRTTSTNSPKPSLFCFGGNEIVVKKPQTSSLGAKQCGKLENWHPGTNYKGVIWLCSCTLRKQFLNV